MEFAYLFLLLCFVVSVFINESDGVQRRDVHRIILKSSSRRPKNHIRHVPEKSSRNNKHNNHKSHRNHKHVIEDDSFESEEEKHEKHERQVKHHRKNTNKHNNNRHHYHNDDEDVSRYNESEEDSYEQFNHKPKTHDSHQHKQSKNQHHYHHQPQNYPYTASGESKWAPIISEETLHLSPPPIPYESESILLTQALKESRSIRQHNAPLQIEFTTAFPINLPTVYDPADYASTAQKVFYTFSPEMVDLTQPKEAEFSSTTASRQVKSKNTRNHSYEVREHTHENSGDKGTNKKYPFRVLAPTLDLSQLAEVPMDDDKSVKNEETKKERKRGPRFRTSARVTSRPKTKN